MAVIIFANGQRRRAAWVLGGAIVAAGLLWAFWPQQSLGSAKAIGALSVPTNSNKTAFVKSQDGTRADGNLFKVNPQGAWIDGAPLAYGELRRFFDYYLSAQGEQSLAGIVRQIQAELDKGLPAPTAKRARGLLDSYLGFKRALVDLEAKPELVGTGVAAIRQRMLAQQTLRTKFFSRDEIDGMFGFEDAMDLDAVARLELAENKGLTVEQKQLQLAALDAAMPAALKADAQAIQAVSRVEHSVTELRAKGASDDDVYRLRAKEFDANAANRLADLDREESAWKGRIATYLEARAQLLAGLGANASASERQQALAALQRSRFSEEEQRRLAAYEPQ